MSTGVRDIQKSSRISEVRAGPFLFIADKIDDKILFHLEYDNSILVEIIDQEAGRFFCGCVNDVFKREGIKP